MKRISYPLIKLTATAGAAVIIALCHIFEIPCLILSTFNVPCISCGLTRACLSALRLDFSAAFSFHPMFWSVPILYLYIIFDAKLFKNKILNYVFVLSRII